jgi:hypothetical protein
MRMAMIASAVCLVVFHLGLIFWGLVPNLVSRPLHLALALPWIFLFVEGSRSYRASGAVFCGLGMAASIWVAWNHSALGDQYGFLEGDLQVGIAIVLLLVVLEAARRAISWPLPTVALLALIYGLFGQYIPGEFGHSGTPLASFLGTLTIAEGGHLGQPDRRLGQRGGDLRDLRGGAQCRRGGAGLHEHGLGGGGPAQGRGGQGVGDFLGAVRLDLRFGVGQCGLDRAITLPAMTRLGYPKRLAAAVEAVASSGGQIMPPLMGAGAFVMVELTGVPYTAIMAAALLPAFLYFFAVWIGINAYASRYELAGLAKETAPPRSDHHLGILCHPLRGADVGHVRSPVHAAIRRLHGHPRRFVMLFFHADGLLDAPGPRTSGTGSGYGSPAGVDDRGDHPVRLDHHRRAVDHRSRGEDHLADPVGRAACCGRRCC